MDYDEHAERKNIYNLPERRNFAVLLNNRIDSSSLNMAFTVTEQSLYNMLKMHASLRGAFAP